jgi:hypothetical protein
MSSIDTETLVLVLIIAAAMTGAATLISFVFGRLYRRHLNRRTRVATHITFTVGVPQ